MLQWCKVLLCLGIFGNSIGSVDAATRMLSRFDITIGDEEPTTCIPDEAIHITPSNPIWKFCREDGTGFDAPPFGGEQVDTGIQSANKEVIAIRYATVELGPGTFVLDAHHRVLVTVANNGTVFKLSDASLPTTPSDYELIIKDDSPGFMSIIPFGTQTINGVNGSPPAIRGQGSRYIVKRIGPTSWDLLQMIPVILPGALSNCTLSDGDINTATGTNDLLLHNLQCTLPANFLTLHREIQLCAVWNLTTGSVAPPLLLRVRGGTTVLAETGVQTPGASMTNDSYITCFILHANAAPSASSNVYTSVIASPSGASSFASRVTTAQPIALATNAPVTLAFESEWDSAGTGTSTIQLLFVSFHARN